MYRIDDAGDVTQEVKRYLWHISEGGEQGITRVSIDRVYDDDTIASVKDFQRYSGINETGKIDLETFNAIYAAYKDVVSKRLSAGGIVTDFAFPLKNGSYGNDVTVWHMIVEELRPRYASIEGTMRGPYYSGASERDTKQLQRIFGMNETGEVDSLLYDRTVMELDSILRIQEIYE